MTFPKPTPKQLKLAVLVALAVLVILVAVLLYVRHRKKVKRDSEGAQDKSDSGRVLPLNPPAEGKLFANCSDDSFPLKRGKCGKRVEQFQLWLMKKYGARFSTFGIDGKWAEETEAIAKKFITKNDPFSVSEAYFNKAGMGNIKTNIYA
jgi:hypothetical protein